MNLESILKEKWIKQWDDNYHNRSDAAKDIDKLMKKNYKGHKYVPWAVMQKWLYLQDPFGSIEIIENESGGLVHTDSVHIFQEDAKNGKVERIVHSHFVKIKATFLGTTMIETYPIQDNSYGAPNFYDSNMVNKALQRGKARLLSLITGLGYQLYETGDLQFEDEVDTNKGKKVVKKSTTVKAPEKKEPVVVDGENDAEVNSFANYLIDNKDTILPVVQDINKQLIKQHNKSIDLDDIDKTIDALSSVTNLTVFSRAVKTRHAEIMKGDK